MLETFHLDVLPVWIKPVHRFHTLLVHGEHNTTAQNQTRQARHGTRPEGQDTLLLEYTRSTDEAVLVLCPRFDRLHSSLDRIQRHRHVDGDDAGQGADAEGADGAQLLAGRHVRLRRLFERRIRAEARRRVGRLPRRRRHEALEEAADALFARDDGTAVQEAAHARLAGLAVVDDLRLDTLERRDSQRALRHTSTKPSNDVRGARDLAIGVGEQVLVCVEGDEADAGLERVADDERRAAGVPLRTERRPGKLLALREPAVQLRARLCELGGIGDGDFDGAGGAARDDGAQGARLGLFLLVGSHCDGYAVRGGGF